MKLVTLEKQENIAIVTINRPEALNALSTQVLADLEDAFDTVNDISDVYCVILTGAGEKSFVAGADISEMQNMTVAQAKSFSVKANAVFRKIESFRCPVIAAVNGYALGGGCELAMCCDIRIASEKAFFAQPEAGLGIPPGFGGTQRMSRIVGPAKAKELIFTTKRIAADEALQIGLVNGVAAPSGLIDSALKMAGQICQNAPIAVSLCKELINRGAQCDIDTALAMEANAFAQCFSTEDRAMAMQAFIKKEKKSGFKNK